MRRRILVSAASLAVAAAACTGGDDRAATPAPAATTCGLRWARAADLPTPRTEVAAAALDGRVYVAGGFLEDGRASDAVEVYDVRAGAWRASVPLPEAVHHTAVASLGSRLWVVGGYTAGGDASARVWSWAPDEPAWRPEPSLAVGRGAHAVAVADGRLVAVGGATGPGGGLTRAVEALRPGTDAWQRLPDLPDPRDHLATSAGPGEVLVIAGRKLSLTTNQTRVDRLRIGPQLAGWSRAPDIAVPRGGIAAASADVYRFVFGGEEPRGTISPVEALVPGRGWRPAGSLPTPRHGLAAVTVGDRVLVIGGGPTPGLSVSGTNEVLTIDDRFGTEGCP